ncbi:hypothetical protein IT575_08325 [bacterium]|nr:hypothetical protein [bacterium]
MSQAAMQPHPELGGERVLGIVSPANLRRLDELRAALKPLFPAIDLVAPDSLEHLGELLSRSQATHRLLLAIGGDGTLHQVLRHMDPAAQVLGLLPGGTGNDFARALGFRDGCSAASAAAQLAGFRIQPSDLCTVNGIRYINSAGFGLDTETVKVREASTGLLHRNYTLAFLAALHRMQPFSMRFSAQTSAGPGGDQAPLSGAGSYYWVLAMNSRDIGRGTRMAPHACLDDGLLDMILLRGVSKLRMLQLLPQALKGRHIGREGVDFAHVSRLDCELDAPLESLAVDGEIYPCGEKLVTFSARSGALQLLR